MRQLNYIEEVTLIMLLTTFIYHGMLHIYTLTIMFNELTHDWVSMVVMMSNVLAYLTAIMYIDSKSQLLKYCSDYLFKGRRVIKNGTKKIISK